MRQPTRQFLLGAMLCAAAACGGSSDGGSTNDEEGATNSDQADGSASSDDVAANDDEVGDADPEPEGSANEAPADDEVVYAIAEPSAVIPVEDVTNNSRALSFALSPTGDRIAVLNADSDAIERITYTISVYDTATAEVISTTPADVGLNALAWTSGDALTGFGFDGFHIRDAASFESQTIVPFNGSCFSRDGITFDFQSNAYYGLSGSNGCRLDAATGEELTWDFELQVADSTGGGGQEERVAVQPGGDSVVATYRSESDGVQLVTLDGTTMQEVSRTPYSDEGAVELLGPQSALIDTYTTRSRGRALEGMPETFVAEATTESVSPNGSYFSLELRIDPATGAFSFQGEPSRVIIDAANGDAVMALIPGAVRPSRSPVNTWSADDSTYAIVGGGGIEIYTLPG